MRLWPTEVQPDVYSAIVLWHRHWREISVLRSAGDPLLGMALLYGSRMVLNAIRDGRITIEYIGGT